MADESNSAAPVTPVAVNPQPKASAPVTPVAVAKAKAAEPAEKLVLLVPHADLKHVISFGGHPRLFVKPGAPTAITPKDHETLKADIGFQNLVKAGKFQVMA